MRGDSAAYGAPAPAFSDHEGLHQATTSRVWPPTSFREARPHFILFIGFVEPLPAGSRWSHSRGTPVRGSPPDIPMTAPAPREAGNDCRNVRRFAEPEHERQGDMPREKADPGDRPGLAPPSSGQGETRTGFQRSRFVTSLSAGPPPLTRKRHPRHVDVWHREDATVRKVNCPASPGNPTAPEKR